MFKKIAKLIFFLWQSRQPGYGYGHGKPWKYRKRKGYKGGRHWDHGGYRPYGHGYGHSGHDRPQGVMALIVDALLRRLLLRR
jgi:hypothetical protein